MIKVQHKVEQSTLESRLSLHRDFWNRKNTRPGASFRVGDFFFSRHFEAARDLLVPHKTITPDLLNPKEYVKDYERMFKDSEACGQDGFWTAEPFTGIPWMEAILGCEVRGGEESFTAKANFSSFADAADSAETTLRNLRINPLSNPWLKKYVEFTEELVALSGGRFPVGQPITRGPSDMVGALLGQSEMIYALSDESDTMRRLISAVTSVFLRVIELQKKIIPPFHGGSSLGFYHVWTPGTSIWYQDDLSAILSPAMYRNFFIEAGTRICANFDYTAIHLHPSSFFILDDLLSLPRLRAIEVNKDVGGPSVGEMMGTLQKIQEKKCLILWGDLTLEDLALVRRDLRPQGLFFHIVAPTLEDAKERGEYIHAWE